MSRFTQEEQAAILKAKNRFTMFTLQEILNLEPDWDLPFSDTEFDHNEIK